jgi:hypothetical protein
MLRKGPALEAHILSGENIVQTVATLLIDGLGIEEDVKKNIDKSESIVVKENALIWLLAE